MRAAHALSHPMAALHLSTEHVSLNSAVALPNTNRILLRWQKDKDVVQHEENTAAWAHSSACPVQAGTRVNVYAAVLFYGSRETSNLATDISGLSFTGGPYDQSFFSSYAWQNERGPRHCLPLLHTGHTGEQVRCC